jgi:Protein of unknown function (DUF3179)
VESHSLRDRATGRLRYSNLIMYDRQTESWWQPATGSAIAGELAGGRLRFLPASIISWEAFAGAFPSGQVLARETGYDRDYGRNPYPGYYDRDYGRNPYPGYDDVNGSPFLYDGPTTPDTLPATARILTVDLGGEAVAYPYDTLATIGTVNDTVGGQPIVVLWGPAPPPRSTRPRSRVGAMWAQQRTTAECSTGGR